MIYSTNGFLESLPPTPLRNQIGQVHAVLIHLYSQANPHNVSAVEIAERSLREIAAFTMEQPRYQPPSPLHPNDFADAMKKAVKGISESLRNLRLQREQRLREVDPAATERASERRLQRAIETERKKGLAFVKAEAHRVRAELGLTESTYSGKDRS